LDPTDLGTPKYTKAQMVAIGLARGHRATGRLFTDWEAAGLIDQPVKRGLGRGKGVLALWPEAQLQLWLLLLAKRTETSQVPNLCNIPVGLWLYFGDNYATIRQVRKCMRTWTERYGSSRGHKLAKQTARMLLADLPVSGASKNLKAQLVSRMATALLNGIKQDEDRRKLRNNLLRAMDEPFSASEKARALVDLVLLRLLASHHLTHESLPDHLFQWARVWHLYNLRNYMQAHDSGDLRHVPGVDFDRPDFEKLILSSCRDLMTSVGIALSISKEEVLPAPFFDPDVWQTGLKAINVNYELEQTPIDLPDGRRHARLRTVVTGEVVPNIQPSRNAPA
jgi:hypothetical protein